MLYSHQTLPTDFSQKVCQWYWPPCKPGRWDYYLIISSPTWGTVSSRVSQGTYSVIPILNFLIFLPPCLLKRQNINIFKLTETKLKTEEFITPRPKFTLGTMQSDLYCSPGNHQTQTSHSDWQTEKHDLSLQRFCTLGSSADVFYTTASDPMAWAGTKSHNNWSIK